MSPRGPILAFLAGCLLAHVSPVAAEGKRYALIVGVKSYRAGQPLPTLAYTENDADGLAKVLRSGGYDVTLMTQAAGRTEGNEVLAPLSDYVRDQLAAVLENPFLKPEDVVLVALAGHGVQYEFTEGAKRTPRFYFCPADADVRRLRTANEITVRHNLLDLGEIYASLEKCRAGGKLLLVDACRNDPSKPSPTRALASNTLPALPPPPGGTAAFFSCSADERAYEDGELGGGHGVFFHHVIEALGGAADSSTPARRSDGRITLAELSEHVSTSTYDHVRRKYRTRQTPELKGRVRLTLPLIDVTRAVNLAGTRAGEARTLGGDIELRWCPPGMFNLGSPANEPGRRDDEDQVVAMISTGYWMGRTEITQAVWKSIMGTTPWREHGKPANYREGPDYPAVYMDHMEMEEFCRKLTDRERRAGRIPEGWAFQLPTEAEWEYACRAGTTTVFAFGNDPRDLDDHAWTFENTLGRGVSHALEVGKKQPNAWGLCDMHGNVWEHCADQYVPGLRVGRAKFAMVTERVSRGGAWSDSAPSARSASRWPVDPAQRSASSGFRPMLGRVE